MLSKIAEIKKYITLENVAIIAAAILALSWAWSTINVLSRNYDLERQVQQGKLDNQILELQNENLKLQQSYYQTNEFLELQARELLNKSKDGEHLVILPHSSSKTSSSTSESTSTSAQKSNFEQWIDFLFGH